ncbi:hypothetical protein ACHAWF_013660 [Thalassiosira exigua]
MSLVLNITALFLFSMAAVRVVAVIVTLSTESSMEPSLGDMDRRLNFPFYYLGPAPSEVSEDHIKETDGETLFDELRTALRHYRELSQSLVHQLTLSYEVASRTEDLLFPHHKRRCVDGSARLNSAFLSCTIREKIAKVATLTEKNIFVLEDLLKQFPATVAMPPLHNAQGFTSAGSRDDTHYEPHFTFPPPGDSFEDRGETESDTQIEPLAKYIPPHTPQNNNNKFGAEEEPYDTASHVITHFARDWTAEGASIREDTHDWIVKQLWIYHSKGKSFLQVRSKSSNESPLSPVLVPGAGMARLAFDIAFAHNEDKAGTKVYPFAVEAIDNSIVMAAAAFNLLHHPSLNGQTDNVGESEKKDLKVYPFVTDPFVNEVDTQRRWESAVFPEDAVSDHFLHLRKQQSSCGPSLSYLIGDFVRVYAPSSKHAVFGAIATCFFLDTASNIYEYIFTVRNLLKAGGVWINVGPVQWHRNSQLQPTTDELKNLLRLAGFQIEHWEINDTMVAYRHPYDIMEGMSTRVEAYRPLKFVVILSPHNDHSSGAPDDGDNLSSCLETLRFTTGRVSTRIVANDAQVVDNSE